MEIKALADSAASQIAAYPVVTGKEKLKRLVKGSVLRQKLAPIDPFSWPNAMLGEGLLASYEATGDKKYLEAVVDHLKRWKNAGYPIHYVDNIMNGSLALWIEELVLNGQAAGTVRAGGAKTPDIGGAGAQELLALCRETEDACAEWLRTAFRTGKGILPYRTHHPDWLFADTLGMVCPFLCRYGAKNADDELLRLGISQLAQFLEKGMDQRSGLPYHGYDEKNGLKYGIIGWGRACGWMLKGMAESLPYIPEDREEYKALAEAFQKLTEAVCQYQRADGGFSWQLEAMEGHRDSSAEGMLGTALTRGMCAGLLAAAGRQTDSGCSLAGGTAVMPDEQKNDSYDRKLIRLNRTLHGSVAGGTVRDCSGECRGFAEYPQNYGSYPWGSGSALEFFALSGDLEAADF